MKIVIFDVFGKNIFFWCLAYSPYPNLMVMPNRHFLYIAKPYFGNTIKIKFSLTIIKNQLFFDLRIFQLYVNRIFFYNFPV